MVSISPGVSFSVLYFSKKSSLDLNCLMYWLELFIIVPYYHFDFCKICSGISHFIPEIGYLCFFSFLFHSCQFFFFNGGGCQSFLFFSRIFLRAVLDSSKIERKVQKFPIYPLPLHMRSLLQYQHPPPEGTFVTLINLHNRSSSPRVQFLH